MADEAPDSAIEPHGEDIATPGWHPIMYPTAGTYGTADSPETDPQPVTALGAAAPTLAPDQEN